MTLYKKSELFSREDKVGRKTPTKFKKIDALKSNSAKQFQLVFHAEHPPFCTKYSTGRNL